MRDNFQIWVDAVCEQVRFWPDRKGIAKELRIHYEDHCQALERLNYERPLAEERSLRAMGNAQEVGRALDRVHKPWLGWLWEVSRVLVVALALLLACKGWQIDYDSRHLTDCTVDQLVWRVPSSAVSHAVTDYLDLWLAPGEPEPYCEPYREEPLPCEARVQVPLTLYVETRDVFHHDLYYGLHQQMEIVADGQPLPFGSYVENAPNRDSGYWVFRGDDSLHGWTRYRDSICLVLDSPPRRVEVVHPRCGWVLTAEWEDAS